ncbi:zymogen granule membrane protein 16-like [Polymixia lowei]
MQYLALLLLGACALADSQPGYYSYSPAVGSGSGIPYSLAGQGRITAVRVWESYNSYIRGLQFRFEYIWSPIAGFKSGETKEMELFEGEAIVQVSGKCAHFVQSVVFTTNRGRSLSAGQPVGHSFNMYPGNSQAELQLGSGRVRGGITSFGAHWAVVYRNSTTAN